MRRIAVLVLVPSLLFASSAAGQESAAVSVQDNEFAPATVTVSEGGTVTWTHGGQNPHSVTADDGSFDSHPECESPDFQSCMQGGETFSHTFQTAGSVPYHCKIHGSPGGGGMAGVVQVEAAQEDPAPSPDATLTDGGGASPLPHTGGSARWPVFGVALAAAAVALAAALRRRAV